MAAVQIVAPRRSCEAVSEAGSLWILPEPWKTPASPEMDRVVVSAFPTTPWTALRAAAQAPQARQLQLSLKAKVMYDSLHWTR
jgi:hypothetical protein